jgi:hypothetical protein
VRHRFRIITGPSECEDSSAPNNQQRRDQRYPVNHKRVSLRTTRPATLADESYVGIGIILDDVTGLSVGQSIELEDAEHPRPLEGVIRHLTPTHDGRWKVGIQLDESHLPV